jgi:hypothetical protein
MPAFGTNSKNNLAQAHPLLQELFNEVVKGFDCSVLCGFRGQVEQDEAYSAGKTTLKFPDSKHNKSPSQAVDVAPYPIDWADRDRFHYFAGYVKGIAARLGIQITWGGDWDNDTQTKDNNFDDLPHFELISVEKLAISTPTSDSIALLSDRLKAKEVELTKANMKIEDIKEIITR